MFNFGKKDKNEEVKATVNTDELLKKVESNRESEFEVFSCEIIAPKSVQVGIKRAKILKNKISCYGEVKKGSFKNNDSVVIINGEEKIVTTIIEAIDDNGSDFETSLGARLARKKQLEVGDKGWIILDISSPLDYKAVLAK